VNDVERKRSHKAIAITPRHYLDFIKHYTGLFGEKRQGLEDEKIHINIGLRKILETQEQVKELQSLNAKRIELSEKKQAAEAKLKQMLSDQNEAEMEKKVSESLQGELKKQLHDIAQKKEQVSAELATVGSLSVTPFAPTPVLSVRVQVEPIVQSAKDAVQGIKKSQLAEIK
jgi:dynein heavy chain 1